MKTKLGELTINQTIELCERNYNGGCNSCPLDDLSFGCMAFVPPFTTKICGLNEREIELPDEENDLLSTEALDWLKRMDYTHRTHEVRMALIKGAKIAFPNKEKKQ